MLYARKEYATTENVQHRINWYTQGETVQQQRKSDMVYNGIRKQRVCNNRKCPTSYKMVMPGGQYTTTGNVRHRTRWITHGENMQQETMSDIV